MISTIGKFTIIDLGKETAQYFWNGTALENIVGVFVYRKTSVTLHTTDKTQLPVEELKAYGIKVKQIKVQGV